MKTLVGKRTRTIKFLSRKRGVYTHSYIQHSSLSQFRTFVKCREMPKSANQHFCQKNVYQKHNFPQQHMHCLQRQKFQSKQKPHTHTSAFQAHPAPKQQNSTALSLAGTRMRISSAQLCRGPSRGGRVPIALSQGWQMVN